LNVEKIKKQFDLHRIYEVVEKHMRPLLYLNKYLFKYKWIISLGIVFVILSNLFSIVLAPMVRTAIDDMLNESNLNLLERFQFLKSPYERWGGPLFFGLLILGSALLKGVFLYFTRQTIIVLSRRIEFDLKNEIFSHYQRLGALFYKRNFTGDLMNRISEDVSRVRMYLGPAILYGLNLIVLFAIVISVMFSINATISLYVLIPLPILSVSIYYVSDIMNKRSDVLQRKLSEITTFSQEAFSGIRLIRAYAVESQYKQRMEEESDSYLQRNMHLVQINSLFMPLMLSLVGLSVVITVLVGGQQVIAGTFTYGNIAEYIIYVNMLTWPVASLGWITSLVQRASASQNRINEFLNEEPEIVNESHLEASFKNSIAFENVSFGYPEMEEDALKNVTFEIIKGKTLGILGTTGSGKTTVAQHVLRILEPHSGHVLLDGKPISDYELRSYRALFGYVPQDIFLFSDSIESNILFGVKKEDNVSSVEVRQAAQMASIKEEIEDFKDGFDTVVGERGITLSGGQKQRVAIARALIRQPEILLLDDSLSAVDVQTEVNIQKNIRSFSENRTSIVISHRVSSVKFADFIIVLDNGNIIERGTLAELLAAGGFFSQLYEKQMHEIQGP
jgi:ATP-binding cassette, subfamily B, multidrug efflux pump